MRRPGEVSTLAECPFWSCLNPLLLRLLLGMALLWLLNMLGYAAVLARLRRRDLEQRRALDAPIARQCLRAHRASEGAVALFSAAGLALLLLAALLGRALFRTHQLRVLHAECRLGARLALAWELQGLCAALLLVWAARAALGCVLLFARDFAALLPWARGDKQGAACASPTPTVCTVSSADFRTLRIRAAVP